MDAEDVECGGEADELTSVKAGPEKPSAKASSGNALQYKVEDVPPPHLAFLFGLQQVLLSISSTISIPLIVANEICAGDLDLVKSQIMSTFLFMCGVCTLLQTTVGVRLPIIQGGCHKFVPAVMALMALPAWKCPDVTSASLVTTSINYSITNYSEINLSVSEMDKGEFRTEIWQRRIREIQGGIMLSVVTQVFIGCTGLLGFILHYIGPITITPTITLVGLSLTDVALRFCQTHWGVSSL